ncbi:MAG: hypothetical protein II540_02060, partial [Paludibacteraceae bacterium]|nr:hypothetical protein [Paludibacteraceae bacterium]
DVAASAATVKNATYAYGVNVYDGTATISGNPEFTVSAYGTTYGAVANGAAPDSKTGLPSAGNLTIDGGTFNVSTTTSTTAYGVYTAGPAPRVITSTAAGYYPGTYYSKPVATVNDGTFNVKAKTTTAIGAYCGRGVLYDQEVLEPHTVELESFGELNIKGGTFNVSTLGTTTADGVRSFGTTNITGGTFNVTPKTTTAMGVRAYAGKTTITGNPHFTVKGTTTVYGLNAGCEAPNAKSGLTYNGEIECNGGTFDLETTTGATCYGVYAYAGSVKITTLHSADANYFAGNYASAGTIVVNDGIFNVKAKTTGAYGVVVPAAVSQSGATGYPTATATAKCDINGGKFLVNGTEKYAVYKKATTANFKISGGYWGGDGVNNNLAYYAVSPNKVLTLRSSHAVYPDGYRYAVGEGGTVTWKNGTTTLLAEVYESGETPEYTGATPTKTADAQYTYTHNGWSPAVAAMENSDVTYTATFSKTENKYTVSVAAGANGSVSPASVSGIGCETASGDITATPNVGYSFSGWTLPEGVTAADGYTVTSNPIRIHAIAADKTITADFVARTDINYTIKHYQQNLADGNYTEIAADQETLQGTTATLTAATAKSYTGFTAQPFSQETIAGEGTTVVNIYYNRNKYTVTWVDGDGETIETDENVKYGATPVYNGETPPKTGTAQYSYTFNGWSPAVGDVVGNATYTATFTKTVNTYTITWKNKNGDILDTDEVAYGATPVYDGTPTQEPTVNEVFTFRAWTPEISSVTEDAIYTADYTASPRPYPVKWVNYDGEVLKEDTRNYGWDAPAATAYDGERPIREGSNGKTYAFAGWSDPVSEVPGGDVTYTALFGTTIVAHEDNTVTISANETVDITTVHVSGTLSVEEGATLTTEDLILEATPSTSGEITGAARVQATRHAYFDLTPDGNDGTHNRKWYAFAVPWEVDAETGVYNKDNMNAPLGLGTRFDILYYDGALRQAQGNSSKCWKFLEYDLDKTLKPGKLYMIHVAGAPIETIRFEKKSGSAIHNSTIEVAVNTGADNNMDANWNGIANPATYKSAITIDKGGASKAFSYGGGMIGADGWIATSMGNALVVGQPIMVQVKNGGSAALATGPHNSPVRRAQQTQSQSQEYAVEISKNGNLCDRLFVDIDEEKEPHYVIGSDLTKVGQSTARAQMWINRYDTKLSVNTVAPQNNKAEYPLSIYAPNAGEYMIEATKIPEEGSYLYLTYDGAPIWNLNYNGYMASLEAGTTDHYGLRLVLASPQVATSIEEAVVDAQGEIRKVLINDQVFIIRGEKVYTIDGQLVK